MTTINTNLNNSYYNRLSQQSASQTPSATSSLADILADSSDSSTSNNNAYTLNLSPAAQAYLNKSGSTVSSSAATTTSSSFTLTTARQKQVTSIIEKYKDSPYTQDIFSKIQSDLNAAGLGTNRLSAEDQISSFNPTNVLIGFLNGSNTSVTPAQTPADEQTKSSNFTQSILAQWQGVSSTYANADADKVAVF